MRIAVEAWGLDHGGEVVLREPQDFTVEPPDTSCEGIPWEPVARPPDSSRAERVSFIDGTRRLEARLFVSSNGEAPVPGIAGSVAVGAVQCEPGPGGSSARCAEITELRIRRYLSLGAGRELSINAAPTLEFESLPHPSTDVNQIVDGLHEQMRSAEAALAQEIANDSMLVLVDGPLAVMRPGPRRIVGFIKAHHARYLSSEDEQILSRLECGARTPMFAFGEPRPRYSWYLRICQLEQAQHPWHGLVRCEAPAALGRDAAASLAAATARLLPRFASEPYWDPRAPQNLVPVVSLEKHMRHLLGDRELITRMIRSAALNLMRGDDHAA
jgi:hypothetical protein